MLPLFAVQASATPNRQCKVRAERIEHKYCTTRGVPTNADFFCVRLQIKLSEKKTPAWREYYADDGLGSNGFIADGPTGVSALSVFPWSNCSNQSHMMPQTPSREIVCIVCVDWMQPVADLVFLSESMQLSPLKSLRSMLGAGDLDDVLLAHKSSPASSPDDWRHDLAGVTIMQPLTHRYLCNQEQLESMPPILSTECVAATADVCNFTSTMLRELTIRPFPLHTTSTQPIHKEDSTVSRELTCLEESSSPVSGMCRQPADEPHWTELLEITFERSNTHGEHLTPSLSPSSRSQEPAPRKQRCAAVNWLNLGAAGELTVLPFPPRQPPTATSTGQVSVVERLLDLQSPWTFMPIRSHRSSSDRCSGALRTLDLPELREFAPLLPKQLPPRPKSSVPANAVNLAEAAIQNLLNEARSADSSPYSSGGATAMERFALTAAHPAVVDPHTLKGMCGFGLLDPERQSDASMDRSPPPSSAAVEAQSPMGPVSTAMDVHEEEGVATKPQHEHGDAQRIQAEFHPPTPTPPSSPAPPASPPDAQITEAVPVFEFSFPTVRSESMVEQYLRLQSSAASSSEVPVCSTVTPPRLQAHQQSRGVPVLPPQQNTHSASLAAPRHPKAAQVTPQRTRAGDQVHRRVTQLAAHNIAPFHAADHPLTVLACEAFLNDYCRSVDLSAHGIEILDAPLQEPVSLILDATSAVCLVEPSRLTSKADLKCLVKALTEVAFKFSRIFLVVVLPPLPDPAVRTAVNSALLTVCQATSRCPATVSIRQCVPSGSNLTVLISQLCAQARRDTMRAHPAVIEAKYAHRPFLIHLQQVDARFLAHCEFLQFFPTVNYYLAALLLYHYSVRELTGQRTRSLWDLLSTNYILTDELKDWLKSFVALQEVHAGLTMAAIADGV